MLRSWALPKGLPTDPGENRLAVAVPDHDLEHLTYVDADKSIADTGWWEVDDRNERRIVFTLHGSRDSARYALIRTARDWLLHLMKDQGLPTGFTNSEKPISGESACWAKGTGAVIRVEDRRGIPREC